MRICPCPKCGSKPIILEGISDKERHRLCRCPNFCDVIPILSKNSRTIWIEHWGEGDEELIFKKWNIAVMTYASERRRNKERKKKNGRV